ncbi:hypothetical protein Kisp02_31550 [Kineosporia sp. NBRC 101731]|nr:hypothetical protein Kisp02_31550 [Kineosporia sp. NBRC 101731]
MQIHVQSMESFANRGTLDVDTGIVTPLTKERWKRALPPGPIRGHFALVNDKDMVLYRRDGGHLRLSYSGQDICLDDSVRVTWTRVDTHSAQLEVSGSSTLEVRYSSDEEKIARLVAGAIMSEPEDYDFGLFVRNVSSDEARRNGIYQE